MGVSDDDDDVRYTLVRYNKEDTEERKDSNDDHWTKSRGAIQKVGSTQPKIVQVHKQNYAEQRSRMCSHRVTKRFRDHDGKILRAKTIQTCRDEHLSK